MNANREVGDTEGGFVCFACREREEMKGEIGKLSQVICELVGTVRGEGSVQREVASSSTQTGNE